MAKKTKTTVVATATETNETATAGTAENAAPVVAKVKKPRAPKVELPKTEAQIAAAQALEAANQAAHDELVANSAAQIEQAQKDIIDAKAAVKLASAKLKALRKAVGIKSKFGGTKVTVLFFVHDYPEGKGAPQARQILEIIKAGGEAGVERVKVVETMKTAMETKMDRSRLLSFYCSRMIADGVIRGA